MRDEDLICREIEEDPHSPGPADARLKRSGVHVWAIIGYYQYAADQDVAVVARDYDLSRDEVEAALAYYRQHTATIDARLAANEIAVAP